MSPARRRGFRAAYRILWTAFQVAAIGNSVVADDPAAAVVGGLLANSGLYLGAWFIIASTRLSNREASVGLRRGAIALAIAFAVALGALLTSSDALGIAAAAMAAIASAIAITTMVHVRYPITMP